MMRAILITIAAIVVIVVGAAVLLYSNLDSIVRTAVEEIGTRATGTKVVLRSAKISPASGEGSLSGFRLGNPQGFKTESAMRFETVSVRIDVGSLASDTIRIKEVVVIAPEITYELGPDGSNIDVIRRKVEAFAGAAGGGAGAAGPSGKGEGDKAGGKKIIVENLYVRGGTVGVSAGFLGGRQMSVPLPDIRLKNIGKDKSGATPAEVAEQVLSAIGDAAARAAGTRGLDRTLDRAKGGAEGARKLLEQGAAGARKTLEEGAKGLGDAVKGLFGR